MFALNMERFQGFSIYLSKIASRNGVELTKHDFSFFEPYMENEQRSKKNLGNQQQNINDASSSSSSFSDKEGESHNVNSSTHNTILDKETIEAKALKAIEKERKKDVTYTSGGNKILSEGELIYSNNKIQRKSSMFVMKQLEMLIYFIWEKIQMFQ